MRKQVAVIVLLILVFAGVGSSAVASRSSAASRHLAAIREEKRLGPKPLPRWYWQWLHWRLTQIRASTSRSQGRYRPYETPRRIPNWAWRRLHYFLLARALADAANHTAPKDHETYDRAISYTQTRPAFTPTRTVDVSNASELSSALANLQAGDLVKATAAFTVTGETIIKNRLSAPAELDLTGVSFVYAGGSNSAAVWLDNAQNLYIYGGNLSTSGRGGTCLIDYGSQHVLWWGFHIHNCGGSGFAAFTSGAAVDHDDFQGEITKVGQNLAWDPHTEKGTGEHGAILWDSKYSYPFSNNRFAFYAHDIPTGACVEIGNNYAATSAAGNTLYLKCLNATDVSTIQTGGNALQLWGYTSKLGLDVKYLEGENLQGYGLRDAGIYSGQTASGVTVEYGRASHTNQNPRYAGRNPWMTDHAVVYRTVRPAR